MNLCTYALISHIAIVKSLAGYPGKVTDSVNLNRIPVLYNKMVASLKNFDFANTDFIKQVQKLVEFHGLKYVSMTVVYCGHFGV